MKMKIALTLLLFLMFTQAAQAQVATPSFTPSYPYSNPALVGYNKQVLDQNVNLGSYYDSSDTWHQNPFNIGRMQLGVNGDFLLTLSHERDHPNQIRQSLSLYSIGYGWEDFKAVALVENFHYWDQWEQYQGAGLAWRPLDFLYLGAYGKESDRGKSLTSAGVGVVIGDWIRVEVDQLTIDDTTTVTKASNSLAEVSFGKVAFTYETGYGQLMGNPLPGERSKTTFTFDTTWLDEAIGWNENRKGSHCYMAWITETNNPLKADSTEVGCGGPL